MGGEGGVGVNMSVVQPVNPEVSFLGDWREDTRCKNHYYEIKVNKFFYILLSLLLFFNFLL